jgi:hypothetical protein
MLESLEIVEGGIDSVSEDPSIVEDMALEWPEDREVIEELVSTSRKR